jgi:hypothetical protein
MYARGSHILEYDGETLLNHETFYPLVGWPPPPPFPYSGLPEGFVKRLDGEASGLLLKGFRPLPGSGLDFCREGPFPRAVPLPNVALDVKNSSTSTARSCPGRGSSYRNVAFSTTTMLPSVLPGTTPLSAEFSSTQPGSYIVVGRATGTPVCRTTSR